jgi:hypothetical protein
MQTNPHEDPPPLSQEPTATPLEEAQRRSDASREKLRGLVKEMVQAIEDSGQRRDDAKGN